MAQKLTKKIVDRALPQAKRDVFRWCGELRGFGVRVKPSGVKTFLVQYRNSRGGTRRYSIGQYGRVTIDQARKEAKVRLAEVARGGDPSQARRAARTVKTVSELCDSYIDDAVAGRVLHRGKAKKRSTLQVDQGRICRHIKPLLGRKPVDELTRRDVERFLHDVVEGRTRADVRTGPRGRARVRGGPGTAAKAVSLLSAVFNYALRRQLIHANPCIGVEKPADKIRERHLTPGEYGKLGVALRQAEQLGFNPVAIAAITTLALTGCRKNEILKLGPQDVDASGRCLRLRDSKSGPQMRPCGQTALDFLSKMPRFDNAWQFASSRGGGPLVNIRTPLMKICGLVALGDVTPHVLRHSFATVAHELGYSELTIAGLLGHRAGTVTARYAHHVDSALVAAADRVSSLIGARLTGNSLAQAKVIEFASTRSHS